MQKENDKLTSELSEKCEQLHRNDAELEKLKKMYDSLHSDYEWVHLQYFLRNISPRSMRRDLIYRNLLEIKANAENILRTAKEWQSEQKQRDEMITKKIAMQTEHIRYVAQFRIKNKNRNFAIAPLRFLFRSPCIELCWKTDNRW